MRNLVVLALLAVSACAPEDQLIPIRPGTSDALYRLSRELSYTSQPAYYPPMQPMFRHTDCDAWRDTLSCTSY